MSVAPMQAEQAARPAPRKRRRRRPDDLGLPMSVLIYSLLIVGSLIFMAPFAWMVVASFKHLDDIFSYPPTWIPHNPTFSNYRDFWDSRKSL